MVTFPLRKESAHKCVYTNGYTIASTLFGGGKKKKKVLSLGQDQKGIIGDVVAVADHLAKRIKLVSLKEVSQWQALILMVDFRHLPPIYWEVNMALCK